MSQKLNVIYKLKKIDEDKVKIQLGILIKENVDFKNQLGSCEKSCSKYLQDNSEVILGREIILNGMMATGLREKAKQLKIKIEVSDKKIEKKQQELAKIMADKKALENLLEKARIEAKKSADKKAYEKLEDLVQSRSFHRSNHEGQF